MVDDIMNGTYAQIKRRAENREEWRRDVIRDLAYGRLPLMMISVISEALKVKTNIACKI